MKTEFTITEAATLYGKSRNTLTSHIRRGALAKNPNNKIELSELLRVYGALPREQSVVVEGDGAGTLVAAQLERQVALLTGQLEQAQAHITWLQGEIAAQRQARIEFQPPKRGLLARLLGD